MPSGVLGVEVGHAAVARGARSNGEGACLRWSRRGATVLACVLWLAGLLVLAGCAERSYDLGHGGEPVYFEDIDPERKAAMRQAVLDGLHRVQSAQRLRVGDTLEIMYHVRERPMAERYRLDVGDRLAVTFGDDSDLDFVTGIQPDGWITLPDTDDVRVVGLTVAEVNRTVSRRYADLLVDPRVTVRLEEWTNDAQRLAEDIDSFAAGRAKQVPVLRDGTITLPFLRPLMAQGHALADMRDRIQAAYDALGLDLDISVLMTDAAGDRIFVFGAVETPGVLTVARPMTTLMAVAQSGGPSGDGSLSDVRVFYVDGSGTPRLRKVNLHNVLMDLALEEDLVLPDNAVVYVPTTVLAQTGKALDLILNQILFYRGFSLSASYELLGNN